MITITTEIVEKSEAFKTKKLECSVVKNGKEIGTGSAMVDDPEQELAIFRIDVDDEYRGRGYGYAQLLAFCDRAGKEGLGGGARVTLVADEGETEGLRQYYGKVGFKVDDVQENDRPDQFSMTGKLAFVTTSLKGAMQKHNKKPFTYTHR
jgi:GNAT superfamily N-acetyltransferase